MILIAHSNLRQKKLSLLPSLLNFCIGLFIYSLLLFYILPPISLSLLEAITKTKKNLSLSPVRVRNRDNWKSDSKRNLNDIYVKPITTQISNLRNQQLIILILRSDNIFKKYKKLITPFLYYFLLLFLQLMIVSLR